MSEAQMPANVPETVQYDARPPLRAFLASHGLLYLLVLGWNLGLLAALLRRLTWRVKITTQRLVVIRGFISRHEEDIPLYRATDVGYNQTIAGRILGCGTITLASDDASCPSMTFPCPQPEHYKELLRQAMTIERQRLRTLNMD